MVWVCQSVVYWPSVELCFWTDDHHCVWVLHQSNARETGKEAYSYHRLTFATEFVVVLKTVRLTRLEISCYPQSEGKAASNIYIISTTMAQRAELSPCSMTEGLWYRCRMAVTLLSLSQKWEETLSYWMGKIRDKNISSRRKCLHHMFWLSNLPI
jgi:hypothetical protein